MSKVTLFKGSSVVKSDLLKALQEEDRVLAGGGGTEMRISIKGSKFRKMQGGEQVAVSKSDTMNVIILRAAGLSRTYYQGAYTPDAAAVPPTCWSDDTKVPSKNVAEEDRQADTCDECPMNIAGSGQGNSRACRFNQKLAVAMEADPSVVYGMQLPAASIFGKAEGNNMPMQAYAKFLRAHDTPTVAIVTEMAFDENSEVPKLFFRPVRPLDEAEFEQAIAARESVEAFDAIAPMEVFAAPADDSSKPVPKPLKAPKNEVVDEDDEDDEEVAPPAKKAAPKKKVVDEFADEADEVEEPKKAPSKKKDAPAPKDDALSAMLDGWDD